MEVLTRYVLKRVKSSVEIVEKNRSLDGNISIHNYFNNANCS